MTTRVVELDFQKFLSEISSWNELSPSFPDCIATTVLLSVLLNGRSQIISTLASRLHVSPEKIIGWMHGDIPDQQISQKTIVQIIFRELLSIVEAQSHRQDSHHSPINGC